MRWRTRLEESDDLNSAGPMPLQPVIPCAPMPSAAYFRRHDGNLLVEARFRVDTVLRIRLDPWNFLSGMIEVGKKYELHGNGATKT